MIFTGLVAVEAADDIGRVKTVKGTVYIDREGRRELALVGAGVRQADTLVTGPDGAVGITLADDTLLSAGPNSTLALERFVNEGNLGKPDLGGRTGCGWKARTDDE